ncbi:MAG: DnaJ domain-containing protein [Myxococcota bacterium]|nr:DnaJ domain-containing protein [Myxococcota bacterium]
MARNFYLVLGVSRDADPSQIRKAHRRLVRIHHPDIETGSNERFAEIQEAYETLADEDAKRTYDQSLPLEHRPQRYAANRRVDPPLKDLRPKRTPMAEPLRRREPKQRLMQDVAPGLFSDIDEFLDGWLPGAFTTGRTASRRKDLYVEIILEPGEAARGGLFPLEIPIRERCNKCGSTGYVGMFLCGACRGQGVVQGKRELEISMPANVKDGIEARLSLEDVGLKGVDLNVLVSVRS